jgi:hypothetical protein
MSSEADLTTVTWGTYASLPILSEDNFADWDVQIVAYLTGPQDRAWVITAGQGALMVPDWGTPRPRFCGAYLGEVLR